MKNEKKYYCEACKKKVHGVEHHTTVQNGPDDADIIGEVVCEHCDNVLIEVN